MIDTVQSVLQEKRNESKFNAYYTVCMPRHKSWALVQTTDPSAPK